MQDQPIINPLGEPFIELPSVDSTNNYALAGIRGGTFSHGTAIFAHEQTAGKGQRGRTWVLGQGGNMALSIVIEPRSLLVSRQFELSATIALAVRQFFSRYAGSDARIKWPNDLYWQDRKAGGILIENSISGNSLLPNHEILTAGLVTDSSLSTWKWSVAGIGININQTEFSPELPNPVSLRQISGRNHSALLLAKELCQVAEEYLQRLLRDGFKSIYKEYNEVLYKLNEVIRLKKDSRVFATTLTGVSTAGQLITSSNHLEERFDFGEISWVK